MDKDGSWSEKKHFVEDAGLLFEQGGMPRMAGRIIGWLLICNPPHQSLPELGEILGASKASISTMTRLLLQMGLIERVGLPGHRRDHFRIKPGAFDTLMENHLEEIKNGLQLVERGLTLVASQPPDLKQRLKEARELYAFFDREYPVLLERWEKERKKLTH
jgi:DNA-binding transcriptional regulator GbsR (MarR family)